MGIVFGNQPCQDPKAVGEHCIAKGLPTDWVGLPNRFMASVGPSPGRGWLLMRLNELNALNQNGLNDLTFTDNSNGIVTIKDLIFVRADCLTPSYTGSTDAVYLVDVRDCRHLAQNEFFANPAFAQYNVRAPGGSQTYYAESLKSGSPFTWQQILDDLWNNWVNVPELGSSPQLGTTPNGTPEGFRFWGVPAWQAYNEVLARIGYGFVLNPTVSKSPSLDQLGGSDTPLTSAQGRLDNSRFLDDYSIEGVRAKVPSQVIVCFQMVYLAYGAEPSTIAATGNWASTPLHKENVSTGAPSGTESGSTATLFDDMPALVNFDGSLNNASALTARAAERAADYYRYTYTGGARMRKTYIGIQNDPGLMPGLQVSAIAWKDVGTRYVTEVVRYPALVGIDDRGGWKLPPACQQLQTPDLARQSFPLYPPAVHLVKIVAVSSVAHVYDATVTRVNPSDLSTSTVESCWAYAIDQTQPPDLAANYYHVGRLIGTKSIGGSLRPLFVIEGFEAGISGTQAVVTSVTCNSGTLTVVSSTLTVENGVIKSIA
jgi:hypothetical protein